MAGGGVWQRAGQCHIVETGNESHRFLHSTAVPSKRIKAREQPRKGAKPEPPTATA